MTEKLFWKLPYEVEFDAEIQEVTEKGLILNRTLFYPRSGNQGNDLGTLIINDEKYKVENVYIDKDEIIHEIAPNSLKKVKVGTKIKGIIDWDNRYRLMKAHTSQHILSALINNNFQIKTSRAFIEREEVLLQLESPIQSEDLKEILVEFNSLCTINNLKISSKLLTKDETQKLGAKLRGKYPDGDEIRVVEIQDFDLNCCGGTHVKNSTEIGPILITEFKKNMEIRYFLGSKAIEQLSQTNIDFIDISNNLNTSLDNISEDFKKIINSNQEYLLYQELLLNQFFNLKIMNPDLEIGQIKLYIITFGIDYNILKKMLDQLPKESLLIIQFKENKIQVISNSEKAKSNEIVNSLIEKYQGKGGGSSRNAQCQLEAEPKDLIQDIQIMIGK